MPRGMTADRHRLVGDIEYKEKTKSINTKSRKPIAKDKQAFVPELSDSDPEEDK